MPRYVLPPTKSSPDAGEVAATREEYSYPDKWARQITIPVNSAIISALEVGGEADITLKGKVQELAQSITGEGRTTLTLALSEVDAYPSEVDEPVSDEDAFVSGFGNRRGQFGMKPPPTY
jgi:hypothetical protein